MKRALMIAMAAGGLFLATSGDANAQQFRRGGSGFGISLNVGSPYRSSRYRGNYGRHFDYGYGYGNRINNVYNRWPSSNYGRSYFPGYRVPSYGYSRGGYGCRYGY